MKITSFNPLILTSHPEEIVKVFEDLGFEQRHNPTGTSATGSQYEGCRMKDANGFHVDVTATSKVRERDETSIRMNVDNFDEARAILVAHGFKSATGDNATDTGSAKGEMLVSPSGFTISLVEHKK